MIDITTISTYPIPLTIEVLQNKNIKHKDEIELYKNILLTVFVTGTIYFIYQKYKQSKKNDRKQ